MPVELPTPRRISAPPEPPRLVVWLFISIVIIVTGVVSTLLTWPKGESTNTAWFWLRLLGFPAFICLLSYGLRLHYYEQEFARLQAEDEVLAEDKERAIQFAREPLSVLASAYACAFDDDAAEKIVARQSLLEARRPPKGKTAIRHTALSQFNQTSLADRYRFCFAHLLRQLDESLHALPTRIPLDVYLQLTTEIPAHGIHAIWQDCWNASGFRPVDATLLPLEQGVMALDTWLNIRGGPELEKVAVFVAVQLHETPRANSAEAAVALLLGWAPLAERKGLTSLALLHRPVEDTRDSVNDMLSRALLWGNTEAAKVEHLWQAGLAHADRSALMQASSDLSLGLSSTEASDGTHDIDAAIGHAGVASAWLAIALAVEHASQTQKPQLVASRQNTLRAAVVQSVATTQESGQQG